MFLKDIKKELEWFFSVKASQSDPKKSFPIKSSVYMKDTANILEPESK